MTLVSQLITVVDAFCAARRLSRARISTLVFNAGSRLGQIADGGDLHTGSFEHAMRWLSSNWPEAVAWPTDVPRPSREASLVRPWPPLPASVEAAA